MMLSTAENRDRISRHEEPDMGLMENGPLETMKRALYVFFCLAIACAQPGAITTVVGAYPDGDGGPAVKAALLGTAGAARLWQSKACRAIQGDALC